MSRNSFIVFSTALLTVLTFQQVSAQQFLVRPTGAVTLDHETTQSERAVDLTATISHATDEYGLVTSTEASPKDDPVDDGLSGWQMDNPKALSVQVTAKPDPMYVRRDQFSTAWVHLYTSSPLNAQLLYELKRRDIYGLCGISAGLSASSFSPPTLQYTGDSRFDYIAPYNVGGYCIKFWAVIDDQPDQSSIFYLMEVSDTPEVTTIHPVEVEDDAAVLRGVVDCRYADTSVWLEWGTSTAYGWATAAATVSKYDTGGVPYDRRVTSLSPATQYHYRLVAENRWGRVYGGDQSFVTPAGVPAVTTGSASLLTGTTAQLNGSANPGGAATTAWFRYATADPGTCNDTFGTRAPLADGDSLGAGSSPVSFAEPISALAVGTTYYFCAIAQNTAGTSFGSVQSFTTDAVLPEVTTSSASLLTGTTAQLNGSANPGGAATTAWFRYATANPGTCNDTFGTRTPLADGDSLGAGSSPVSFAEPISALAVGTTYYYCAIAQNAEGTGFGSVVSFTPEDPPAVASTSPANDAMNVAVDANITVTFTEDVTVVSWFAISCSSSGTHTAASSGGPLTYTLDPDIDFASGELCTVSIYLEGVSDNDAFDPPDNMEGDHVFSFTTRAGPLFTNGFESGDTSQWSTTSP